MAYSTPLTAVSNSTLTAAQWNATVRDNMLETPAAKATTAGRFFVTTAANAIAERAPGAGNTLTSLQTTTATAPTYADLTTAGPAYTCVTGTTALVIISCQIENSTASLGGLMGYEVTGASSVAPDANKSLRMTSSTAGERNHGSRAVFQTGLTAGTNTFTAKYSTPNGGTAGFTARDLFVLPF